MGRTRTLDSHASRLRRKLDPEAARFVINCWGIGDEGGAEPNTLTTPGHPVERDAVRLQPLISVYAFLTVAGIALLALGLAQQWCQDDACTGDAWLCEVGNFAFAAFVLSIFPAMATVVLAIVEFAVRRITGSRHQQRSPWRDLLIGVVIGLALEVVAHVVWWT
jgi:hypothetical protein